MSQLSAILEPPTRLRGKIERRSLVEVEFEIPAGTTAFCVKGVLLIDAGPLGYMTAQDAASHGLVKIVELPAPTALPEGEI